MVMRGYCEPAAWKNAARQVILLSRCVRLVAAYS